MGLPGHRRTSSHRNRRRSHHALKKLNLGKCPGCAAPVLPHIACGACGMYGGRKVITIKNGERKNEKRKR